MQAYIPIIACVVAAAILFMLWRDISTLKSRVTDVVNQHNNVKQVLDKHESMLHANNEFPLQFAFDTPQDIAGDAAGDLARDAAGGVATPSVVIKEEPEEETKTKTKKTK